jgi:hypothetical protein
MTEQQDSDGLVERAALAIRDLTGGENYDYMDFCRDAARAAIEVTGIEAMSRQLVELQAIIDSCALCRTQQANDRKALEGSATCHE